jgi:hypothetical protein
LMNGLEKGPAARSACYPFQKQGAPEFEGISSFSMPSNTQFDLNKCNPDYALSEFVKQVQNRWHHLFPPSATVDADRCRPHILNP